MKKEVLGSKHLLGAGNFIHLSVVLTIILLLREWGSQRFGHLLKVTR